MSARLRLGFVALVLAFGAACNTVFGLDPLTFQDPRVGVPIPDANADADSDSDADTDAEVSADANTSDAAPPDAPPNDASDASDATDGG